MPKPAKREAQTEDQIDRHLLLLSPLAADPDKHSIRIRNSAGYMVAQVHQYSNGCGPTRADAEIYARIFTAAPQMLAALRRVADATEISAADIDMVLAAIAQAEAA